MTCRKIQHVSKMRRIMSQKWDVIGTKNETPYTLTYTLILYSTNQRLRREKAF